MKEAVMLIDLNKVHFKVDRLLDQGFPGLNSKQLSTTIWILDVVAVGAEIQIVMPQDFKGADCTMTVGEFKSLFVWPSGAVAQPVFLDRTKTAPLRNVAALVGKKRIFVCEGISEVVAKEGSKALAQVLSNCRS